VKKFTFIFSFLAVILGIAAAIMGLFIEYASGFEFLGAFIAFVGVAMIVVVRMYPGFGESMESLIVSVVALAGAALFAIEAAMRLGGADSTILMIAGIGLVILSFILCPCLWFQTGNRSSSNVIGIAAAHESISINEISQKTGLSTAVVSSVIYDAIGKGKLSGQMVGDTFKRTGPAVGVSPDAKVLVICPYCGAKTEQGLAKCVKCGADI